MFQLKIPAISSEESFMEDFRLMRKFNIVTPSESSVQFSDEEMMQSFDGEDNLEEMAPFATMIEQYHTFGAQNQEDSY